MGNTHSMSHPPVFVSEPNLTPSDKKLGLTLSKVFFETTETKETTAKQTQSFRVAQPNFLSEGVRFGSDTKTGGWDILDVFPIRQFD